MASGGPDLKNYLTGEVTFPDDALIIEEGCKSHSVYLVLEGQVKVKKKTSKAALVLETLKPGSIVGEICLLLEDSGLSTATVVADGEVRLGVLDTQKILDDYRSLDTDTRDLLKGIMLSLLKANAFLVSVSAPGD